MTIPTNDELIAALGNQLDVAANLPCPPGVASHILDLCEYPGGGPDDFANAARTDCALTARLLRLANAPERGAAGTVFNVDHAVTLLGLERTRREALSLALVSATRTDTAGTVDYPQFWRRSLTTAIANHWLAQHQGAADAEHYFVAGLLQDCGMVLLSGLTPNVYASLATQQHNHGALIAAEQTAFASDHTQAGGWLLEHWNLPAVYVHAARGSHIPAASNADAEHAPVIYSTAVAATIADIFFSGEEEQAVRRALAIGGTVAPLAPQTLAELLPHVHDALETQRRVYQLDLGPRELLTRRVAVAVAEAEKLAKRARERGQLAS